MSNSSTDDSSLYAFQSFFQEDTSDFLKGEAPKWIKAKDFETWLAKKGNELEDIRNIFQDYDLMCRLVAEYLFDQMCFLINKIEKEVRVETQ